MPSRSPFPAPRHLAGGESAKQRALHPLERALLVVVSLLVVFQVWANGGMRLWGQEIAGGLAVLAFVLALLPRTYHDEFLHGKPLRLTMWRRLLKFPFFWVGIAYVTLVLLQVANPAWMFVQTEHGWFLQSIAYIDWLPHGIADTPAAMMNPGRALLIQGAVWLVVCALWVGISRRKSARILIYVLAANGVLEAIAILLQRLTNAKKMLWLFDPRASYFTGTFTYKNHGGEYLVLVIATLLALGWWHAAHAERRLRKSHPGFLFVFLAAVVGFALMVTYARAATALGGALLVITAAAYGLRQFFRRSGGTPRIVTIITALLGLGFLYLSVQSVNTDKVWIRFERLFKEDEFDSITTRQLTAKATFEMADDSLVSGHGVGGYRFLFPLYQQRYPEIWTKTLNVGSRRVSYRYFFEHAHNDYAELTAEAGLIGAGLLIITVLLVAGAMRRYNVLTQPPLLILLAGPALLLVNAAFDFPGHNPAILTTAAVIAVTALRWGGLSGERGLRASRHNVEHGAGS